MSFSRKIGTFRVGSLGNVERLRKAVTFELLASVIQSTPVDRGPLAANWRTSVDAPNTSKTNATGPSVATSELAQNLGDGLGKNIAVFLRNNLPYAAKIEFEGYSKTKAPQGMVRINFARAGAIIRRAIQALK